MLFFLPDFRPLKRQYQEIVKSVFLQHIGSTSSAARKKTHDNLADKVGGLWMNAKLFEKGLKMFGGERVLPYRCLCATAI